MATNDLSDVDRIAQLITDEDEQIFVLANVVQAMTGRAARLAANASRIAQSIASEDRKALALASLAQAMAATDPHRAERIAESITYKPIKVRALLKIANALVHGTQRLDG